MNLNNAVNSVYYKLKPFIPRRLQIWMRSKLILLKRRHYSSVWPILERAGKPPAGWSGWPESKQFALVLTHDVDTARGQEKCYRLMKLEKNFGFRSSFNFVPERYDVSSRLRDYLIENGFEVGVHGLNHDGKLFSTKKIFQQRSVKINQYLKDWEAMGFRSPAMHHNLDWICDLKIEYDSSTFDTDPFEPQSDGVGTIFPFWVNGNSSQRGYVELPYTLPQDFTLFVLLKERTINIWKQKLDWIVNRGGMVLLNIHPDYMNFEDRKSTVEEYPAKYYKDFLKYVEFTYKDKFWQPLPKEISYFVAKNF